MRLAPGVAGVRPGARAHRRLRPASGWPRSAPPACCRSAACPPRSPNLTPTIYHDIRTLPCPRARAHRRQRPASGWPRSAPPACCRSAACPPQIRASGPRSPPGPPAAPGDRAAQSAHTREVMHAMAASSHDRMQSALSFRQRPCQAWMHKHVCGGTELATGIGAPSSPLRRVATCPGRAAGAHPERGARAAHLRGVRADAAAGVGRHEEEVAQRAQQRVRARR